LEYVSVFASKDFIRCYKLAERKVVPLVTAASFPGLGPDGEAPPPGVPARDEGAAGGAGFTRAPDDDWDADADADADMARMLAACEAGLIAIPDEPDGPGGMGIVAGTVVDPAELAAFGRAGGLAGSGQQAFTQGGTADVMPAGPLLTILAEQAVTGEPGPPGGHVPAAMAGNAMAEAGEAAAAAASRAAGTGPLAGIPGVAGADGVRELSDDDLLGLMSAADRMANRAQWARLATTAEFTRRRRCQQQAAIAARAPEGRQAGQHAADEVAFETVRTGRQADEQCWLSEVMASRLPRLMSRMGHGAVDGYRALIVARATDGLSAEDVAVADQILAAEAPGLTTSALSRRARQVVMTLDPEAAARRKKKARKQARVQMWREESGNAALAGREMDPADALAASAYYDGLARALRKGGVPGSLRELRHLAFTERNKGADPLDLIARHAAAADQDQDQPPWEHDPGQDTDPDSQDTGARDTDGAGDSPAAADPRRDGTDYFPEAADGYRDGGRHPGLADDWRSAAGSGNPDRSWEADAPHGDGWQDGLRDDGYRDDENPDRPDDEGGGDDGDNGGYGNGGGRPQDGGPGDGAKTPVAANITLLVSAGTLYGWSTAPGEAAGLGFLDPETTRDLVQNASEHPSTRWCVTVVDDADGTAVAHGCASGRHRWDPGEQPGQRPGQECARSPGTQPAKTDKTGPAEPARQAARAAQVTGLIERLGVRLEPIARGTCDHAHREERYAPSRKLRHLIQARTATCCAPGCTRPATGNDIDHTIPWPAGASDECNLSPPCEHHHMVKHTPGWKLEQNSPGVMRWIGPSGRGYTTHPTKYQL
jgi:hypothetical protein